MPERRHFYVISQPEAQNLPVASITPETSTVYRNRIANDFKDETIQLAS
jgi:hypothetical protein